MKNIYFKNMPEYKKLLAMVIVIAIVVSSAFGASAGFLVMNSAQAQKVLAQIFSLPQPADPAPDTKTIQVQEDSAVIDAVKKVNPAVVNVVVTKDLPKIEQFYSPFGDSGNDFFSQFFGNDFMVPGQRQNGTEKQEIGGGSGFIISNDGLVVTNKHVVLDEQAEYTVLMNDEKKYDAKVLARDSAHDLAILKIDAQNLPTVELGDSDSIQVGQSAIAIGNALGEFRNTVSVGVISGLARTVTAGGGNFAEDLTNLIQTDASINPGNSGGPLLNIAGQVIGVNTAVAQGAQGIGFAIPINELKQSIDSVKQNGKIVRPWLGVRYVMLNETIAKQNNLSVSQGALIVRGDTRTDLAVVPGSPADKAALVENDIILAVDGKTLDDKNNNLADIVAAHKPGDEVTLKIWHKGDIKEAKVKLEEYGQ